MDFLQLNAKKFIVFGVANKRSLAFHIVKMLLEQGSETLLVVQNEAAAEKVRPLLPGCEIYTCDLQHEEQIAALKNDIAADHQGVKWNGIVHSVAFADYSEGMKPFHETPKRAFLQALEISCFSLTSISNYFADILDPDASVVTISISTTRMASENYGYMAPIKAALDSSLAFLAKSFSAFSRVRFNAVAPSLLKTSASSGIPGYADSYLYAEKAIPRKKAVQTGEAAATAVFLLSPRSSGINAQKIIVDAGMEINYFDKEIIGNVSGK